MIDQFLQTKAWADFQEVYGRKTYQIQDLILIKMPLPFGKCYLYSPRGPQTKNPKSKIQNPNQSPISNDTITKQVIELAKKEGAIFWRFEPEQLSATSYKLQAKVDPVQPKHEWILDISQSEEELLKGMKSKARYNLRLAQKKGVTVEVSQGLDHFEDFWRLVETTSERKGIKSHTKKYYQKMIEILSRMEPRTQNPEPGMNNVRSRLYLAKYQGKIVCANLVIFYGNCATYLHGASADEYRNVMAPYPVQWQAILDAKEQGCQYYNFGGVNPEDEKDPVYKTSWQGITRFKQGFGGQRISYPGTFDLPVNKAWYRLYRAIKKFL